MKIISERSWGDPKLPKPKILKGIKQSGSAQFGKCKCPVFFTEEKVYVKHRDWFSASIPIPEAERLGIIDKIKNKFIYNDNFGSVVLRDEAWLEIDRDFGNFEPDEVNTLIYKLSVVTGYEYWDLAHYTWVKFFEDIYRLEKENKTS